MVIRVAHDYICPWCWIAVFQTKRLKEEFGVSFDWVGYELMPEELPWGDPAPKAPENPNRAATPSRLDLAYAAEGMEKPTAERPSKMRSHNALEATEFVKEHGDADGFIEAMYRALWEEGREINDLDVIREVAAGFVPDVEALVEAVKSKAYDGKIVKFDDGAYAAHVYNVPTYWIGDEKYAEQPYPVLAKAIRAQSAKTG